jgi:hypothetical protein
VFRLVQPGGVRAIVAESVLTKHLCLLKIPSALQQLNLS